MECDDGDASGNPTELTLRRYRNLAEGGAGIIVVESLTLTYESRARKNQLKISEETAKDLERLVKEMKEVNGKPLILFQLNHSGGLVAQLFKGRFPLSDRRPNIHLLKKEEDENIGDKCISCNTQNRVGLRWNRLPNIAMISLRDVRPANIRQDRFGGDFENRTRVFRRLQGK
jgi:2,4-dienoyl-CoA reductase-like NADH-dependent reductase (Old Yellow Enzyme family)